MPLYCFECPKCHRQYEMLQKNNESPPKCFEAGCDGNVDTIKQIAPFSFQLKGTGWYRDGYTKKKE